jgi:hypothetical protein
MWATASPFTAMVHSTDGRLELAAAALEASAGHCWVNAAASVASRLRMLQCVLLSLWKFHICCYFKEAFPQDG